MSATTFWQVTFPIIFPGILAAGLLAFALSIDDYVITLFSAGRTVTFPLWVFGASRVGHPARGQRAGHADLPRRDRLHRRPALEPAAGGRGATDGRRRHRRRRRHDAPRDVLTDWSALRDGVPPVWARYTDLIVERASGSWIETIDGERYLDYTCGIGVMNTGHAHPRVVAAIAEQAARGIHLQQNIVYHQPGLELHRRLPERFPNPADRYGLRPLPLELRRRGGRGRREAGQGRDAPPAVIAFRGGFHGRTHGTMALTCRR